MQVTLENTDKVVLLELDGVTFPARIWEGHTANGVKCHAYITRIAVRDQERLPPAQRDIDSPVVCNCAFDEGHTVDCDIVAAHRLRRHMSETSETPASRPLLCGAFNRAYFCTRPRHHDGEHVATLGPSDDPGAAVLARWPNPPNNGGPADAPEKT